MYKAAITDFDGENTNSVILPGEYPTLEKAVEEATSHKKGPMSIIEVRAYAESRNAVIALEVPQVDTGITVYRDYSDIEKALDEKFWELYPDDTFEGTMSFLLDMIKDGVLEGDSHLRKPVDFLTDNEVDMILEKHGDLEYMRCENGNLITQEEHPKEERLCIYTESPDIREKVKQGIQDILNKFPVSFISYGQLRNMLKKADASRYVIGVFGSNYPREWKESLCDASFDYGEYINFPEKLFEELGKKIIDVVGNTSIIAEEEIPG